MVLRPIIIVPFALLLFSSVAIAGDEALCGGINDALREVSPSYADGVNVAGRQVSCTAVTKNGPWVCAVHEEAKCNPAEIENAGVSSAPTSAQDSSVILDIYDQTTREVTSCMAGRVPRALKYQKFNSQEDAYASNGSQFLNDSATKGLYVMLRAHVFAKDKEVCRTGSVSVEVQDPKDFEPFR